MGANTAEQGLVSDRPPARDTRLAMATTSSLAGQEPAALWDLLRTFMPGAPRLKNSVIVTASLLHPAQPDLRQWQAVAVKGGQVGAHTSQPCAGAMTDLPLRSLHCLGGPRGLAAARQRPEPALTGALPLD